MGDKATYTYDEVYGNALKYFGGDELAARVWVNKYALKDPDGNICEFSPEDMHHRIARELARIEAGYPNSIAHDEIFALLDHFRYLVPASTSLRGIGNNNHIASLSNSFVIGLDGNADSYGAIMRIDEEQVQLLKRRGGVGHDLSHLRPKGTKVNNSALTSTGILSFMQRYSNTAREVAQDGRRGGLSLTVSVRHPDSEAFIDAKMEKGQVAGANLSIKVDDVFMEAVVGNGDYVLQYPVNAEHPKVQTVVAARHLWNKIVHNVWKSAEPSVLFWDTIIRESIPDCYADFGFRTVSTNPYGEVPLCPYDSCRLMSLNLYSYVKNPFTAEAQFDYDLFASHVRKAQRLMDDIVDLELEKIKLIMDKIKDDPEPEETKSTEYRLWEKIYEKSALGRRTGLGVTAEGDMLAAMGLRYGTQVAIDFAEGIHRTLAVNAYRASVEIAKERGAFGIYDAEREKDNSFILRIKEADWELYEDMKRYGRRNIALLTIAPTGTTSIMTQTTSGVEPIFKPVYKRRRKMGGDDEKAHVDYIDEAGNRYQDYMVCHDKLLKWMQVNGYDTAKVYSMEELNALVCKSPYYQSTTADVDYRMKVRMQGRIQKWVDQSVSVTINLPADIEEVQVGQLYAEAWRCGCKGCTVYRDGSRSGVSMAKKDKKTNMDQEEAKEPVTVPNFSPDVQEVRPKELECDVVRFQNNKEKWVAFVGLLNGYPYEIFTGLQDDEEGIVLPKTVTKGVIVRQTNGNGSHRYDFQFKNKRGYKTTVEGLSEKFNPEYWNYAKLISGVLRYRMPIDNVIKLVASLQLKDESINTWKNGVVRALKKYVTDGTLAKGQTCPVCGHESLVYQEGCLICTNCGASNGG